MPHWHRDKGRNRSNTADILFVRQADPVDERFHRRGVNADLVAVANVVQDLPVVGEVDQGECFFPSSEFVVGKQLDGLRDDVFEVVAFLASQALHDIAGHEAENAGVAPLIGRMGPGHLMADALDRCILSHGFQIVGDQGFAGAGNAKACEPALPFRRTPRESCITPPHQIEVGMVEKRNCALAVDVVACSDRHTGVQRFIQHGLRHDVLQPFSVARSQRGRLDDVLTGRCDNVAFDVDRLEVVDHPRIRQAGGLLRGAGLEPRSVVSERQQRLTEVLFFWNEDQVIVVWRVAVDGGTRAP